MPQFKKAAVIGVGLIGGSFAAALKEKRIATQVVGVSRKFSTVNTALKKGLIDSGDTGLSLVAGADLLVFAVPPGAVNVQAEKIASLTDRNCLVIDVCSTKETVVKRLSALFARYVGCHPLAGSEKKGPESASAFLFRESLCVITPVLSTGNNDLAVVKRIWRALGARILLMTPSEHDRVFSFVSHLPHALAFSLVASVPDKYLKFAAGGFRDTTRIAASDDELWADIFRSNKDNIIKAIEEYQKHLALLKSALSAGDQCKLQRLLFKASLKRRNFERTKR